jgi:hypothetical protein
LLFPVFIFERLRVSITKLQNRLFVLIRVHQR